MVPAKNFVAEMWEKHQPFNPLLFPLGWKLFQLLQILLHAAKSEVVWEGEFLLILL